MNSEALYFMVGLVIYLVALVLIGSVYGHIKAKGGGKAFLDGGQQISPLILIGTIAATAAGSGFVIGSTGNGFNLGWAGMCVPVGCALASLLVIPCTKTRRYKFNGLADELQFYYGGRRGMRVLGAFLMVFIEVMWMGSGITGGAKYICYVTGIDEPIGKLICAIAMLLFTFFGGYLSVALTDAIQMAVLFFGFLGIAFIAIPRAGGFEAIQAAYAAADNAGAVTTLFGIGSAAGFMVPISLIMSNFASSSATPSVRQRIFSAKDEADARRGFKMNFVICALISIAPAIIGMAAFTITQQRGVILQSSDYAFSFMCTEVLPPFLGLVLMLVGVSATLSSVDSNLMCACSSLVDNFYPMVTHKTISPDGYRRISRVILVVLTIIGYGFSLSVSTLSSFMLNITGSFMPGIACALFVGCVWKRATYQGGYACIIGGFLYALCYQLVAPFKSWVAAVFGGPSIPGWIISIILIVCVSLLTPQCTLTDDEKAEKVLDFIPSLTKSRG